MNVDELKKPESLSFRCDWFNIPKEWSDAISEIQKEISDEEDSLLKSGLSFYGYDVEYVREHLEEFIAEEKKFNVLETGYNIKNIFHKESDGNFKYLFSIKTMTNPETGCITQKLLLRKGNDNGGN